MAELIVEPEAEAELEEAGDRYQESVPGLGLEFLLEMRQRTLELAEAPLSYPVFGGIAGRPVRSCGWGISRGHHEPASGRVARRRTRDEPLSPVAPIRERRRVAGHSRCGALV